MYSLTDKSSDQLSLFKSPQCPLHSCSEALTDLFPPTSPAVLPTGPHLQPPPRRRAESKLPPCTGVSSGNESLKALSQHPGHWRPRNQEQMDAQEEVGLGAARKRLRVRGTRCPAGSLGQLWEEGRGVWCPWAGTSREGQREAPILCFCACHHHRGGRGAQNSPVAHVLAGHPPVALSPVVPAHGMPGLPLCRVHLKDEVRSIEANCGKGGSGETQTVTFTLSSHGPHPARTQASRGVGLRSLSPASHRRCPESSLSSQNVPFSQQS